MANLNLSQDVANKKRMLPNLILYRKLQERVVTSLLLTSTPLQEARIETSAVFISS